VVKVRLLAFASAADALGAERWLELPGEPTVGDLKRQLAADHPELAALWPRVAVAIDGTLAGDAAPLREGSEVALLPPVSGGAAPRTALVEEPLDVAATVAAVGGADCGAVVLFLGTVRDHHQGRTVSRLTYSAYLPLAVTRLAAIAAELEAEHGARLAVSHRLGELLPGEASVVIAAAAPHRAAAYTASRACLERLKREVPIWKRELYADGTARWREEEALSVSSERDEPGAEAPAAGDSGAPASRPEVSGDVASGVAASGGSPPAVATRPPSA
jgi:molybdopterin synthase catalytic subunit